MLGFLTLATCSILAFGQGPFRMLKVQSGPSGKVEGSKFLFDQVRSNFEFPKDQELIVYFEWSGPAGKHSLSGVWKDPSGKPVQISDIAMETTGEPFSAYWTFRVVADMTPGVWELEARINGVPAGSHAFHLSIPAPTPSAPPAPKTEFKRPVPTLDELFARRTSLVWIDRLDEAGRRVDRATGFVSAANQVTTAFQAIDGSDGIEVEFATGKRLRVTSVAAVSRMQDWAVLHADTGTIPPLKAAAAYVTPIGERLLVFNVENGARTIGGVDYTGKDNRPEFGGRILISPSPTLESAGGPLMDKYGDVTGVLGGSLTPGSRVTGRALSVSPGLFNKLRSGVLATPIHDIPSPIQVSGETFDALLARGILTPGLRLHPNVRYGGTAGRARKKDENFAENDLSEFSRRDETVVVFAQLEEIVKAKNAVIRAEVYDAQNRRRVNVPAAKVKWAGKIPVRWSASFSPAQLVPGVHRVDLLLDGQVVWRTFFEIRD